MLFSVPMARLPNTTAHSVLSSILDELCCSRYNNLEPTEEGSTVRVSLGFVIRQLNKVLSLLSNAIYIQST